MGEAEHKIGKCPKCHHEFEVCTHLCDKSPNRIFCNNHRCSKYGLVTVNDWYDLSILQGRDKEPSRTCESCKEKDSRIVDFIYLPSVTYREIRKRMKQIIEIGISKDEKVRPGQEVHSQIHLENTGDMDIHVDLGKGKAEQIVHPGDTAVFKDVKKATGEED